MTGAGFRLQELEEERPEPGTWEEVVEVDRQALTVQVDLIVPEGAALGGGRRGARLGPHGKRAARKAIGLEAALVDHSPMTVTHSIRPTGAPSRSRSPSPPRFSSPRLTRSTTAFRHRVSTEPRTRTQRIRIASCEPPPHLTSRTALLSFGTIRLRGRRPEPRSATSPNYLAGGARRVSRWRCVPCGLRSLRSRSPPWRRHTSASSEPHSNRAAEPSLPSKVTPREVLRTPRA